MSLRITHTAEEGTLSEGTSPGLWRLVDELGVEDAGAAVHAGDVPVAVAADVLAHGDRELAARDLETLTGLLDRLVTPENPEWPAARLSNLHSCPFTDADADVAPLAHWSDHQDQGVAS
ncbi:hypothetical protein [Nocardia brasiliensis]|uniref:hypothetical protein n=1 Tax=Nocardia brasiliensis TaxID=37326 RepID=UPI0004A6DC50|nr:hypothetical protein [Nocardia brasiliensis]